MLVMLVNSAYLGGVALLQYVAEERGAPVQLEGWAFQWFFLVHVVLGLLLLVPAVVFVAGHLRAVRGHPNRRAARFGYALLAVSVVLLVSGVALTRIDGIGLRLADPAARSITYWAHVGSAVLVVGIFALHRRAGGGLRPRRVAPWLAVGGALTAAAVALHLAGPRPTRPDLGEERLFPALSATAHGGTIPTEALMNDDYCLACHPDVHERWSHSAHRFSSFNNPAYRFSVLATRAKMRERDGDVSGARFCAGCHDPVPLFAGVYDDPAFDDPAHLDVDPAASAGITCTVCHAITSIDSVKGNADYTIAEPVHYPFADAEGGVLQWINHQLVKANPAFHKRTFLKPLHESAEFCGACHKVHLPEELNDYKWLRGQNHYDAFLLSGASGHGVASWYYPESAEAGCNACHMELRASSDFGAADNDGSGRLTVHDHLFPSANAAIPQLLGSPDWVTEAHQDFNDRTARLDVFALREGGTIDGPLVAPLRPELPALHPGATYLVDVDIRPLRMGHPLTQGTADSNQLWLDVTVRADGEVIGRSGGLDEDRALDPWSHHVNAFVLDRDGRRIDRRNAEDIFVPLYNNQIPPGAADTVHYRLDVPVDAREITIDAALRYRKFDTQYLRLFMGDPALRNDLPILTLATDSVTLPVGTAPGTTEPRDIPEWQRWYDYGIGAIRKRGTGELRTAELAFDRVAQLGRGAGHLAVARVLLREGRLDGAAARINLAAAHEDPPPPWSIAWSRASSTVARGISTPPRTTSAVSTTCTRSPRPGPAASTSGRTPVCSSSSPSSTSSVPAASATPR